MGDLKKCPKCGSVLENDAAFCYHCMTSLDKKQRVETKKSPLPKRTKTAIISIILVFIVILAAGAGIFVYRQSQTKPICSEEEFLLRAEKIEQKLGLSDIIDTSSFKDIKRHKTDNTTEYTAELSLGGASLSLYFHNKGEVISAVLWDVNEEDIENGKKVLILIADAVGDNYYTDISDVFFDENTYPLNEYKKPFEEYFTDFALRTKDYENAIKDGLKIKTEYISMTDSDLCFVLYKTSRETGSETVYDLTLYIERLSSVENKTK